MTETDSHNAISALIHRYAELIDTGDLAGVGELFEDATYRSDRGGLYRGAAAVRDVLQSKVRLYDGIPRTKHVTTNVVIEVDETNDAATSRSYYTVLQATDGLSLQPIIAGRYHDRFTRVGSTWRFSDRLVFIDLVGDLSQHLR